MKYGSLNLGQIEAIVNRLGGMEGVQAFLAGNSEVVVKTYVIDCDAGPMIPFEGWKVEEHRKGGHLTWDPTKVLLHLSPNQIDGKSVKGDRLRKELAEQPVLNANVLDYLLANPHLIPEEWKGKAVFFWGTIYRSSGGSLCVRCLCWDSGHWQADYNWLDVEWSAGYPSAVSAS